MRKDIIHNLILIVVGASLLSLPWLVNGVGLLALIAWVPLLIVFQKCQESSSIFKSTVFALYALLFFLLWNIFTTWWIYKATLPGAITVILFYSILMSLIMSLSFKMYSVFGKRIGYLTILTNWLSYEYLFMNSEIGWPWLVLGNAFAKNIQLIQWYEFTGHLGGTVWVLLINLLAFDLYNRIKNRNWNIGNKPVFFLKFLIIILPLTYSLVRYNTYNEKVFPIDIVVVQPNIDSYDEKYTIPIPDQINIILAEAAKVSDSEVDLIVTPETVIPTGLWEHEATNHPSINHFRSFLIDKPKSKLIIGVTTRYKYSENESPSRTARLYGEKEYYYDLFNSSVLLDTSSVLYFYHKSKLVPGVEAIPYPKVLGFLHNYMIDFGGIKGSHGTQLDRSTFPFADSLFLGTVICYESAFGEFVSEFVKKGAGLLLVITNDGWWEDTPGYRQHLSYSSLRAIETRRSIARSANTGVSCFINQRGDIISQLDWCERGAIREKINYNEHVTFYVKYGDYIARMCVMITVIILAIYFVGLMRKRFVNNKVGQE